MSERDVPHVVVPPSRPELSVFESLRATVAGNAAVKVASSALALFEAGGKRVLAPAAQVAIRKAAERGTARALAVATSPLLEAASAVPGLARPAANAVEAGTALAPSAARAVSVQVARTAAKQVLRGASRAAAIGFVVDGAVAGIEAVVAVRNGSTDKESAIRHVAKEAASGAVATGAGVLAGAGLVALTGGIAAPVVFAVSAAGSIGVKRVVRRWLG